jgi:site-specific recombinase XerD
LPVTPQGLDALRDLVAGDALGPFSMSSAAKLWWRAIHTMVDRLAATDHVAARTLLRSLQRVRATPYTLRHSYLTQVQLAGQNIHATQQLAMHRDIRQTERYTLASVDPQLLDVIATLGPRLPSSPVR